MAQDHIPCRDRPRPLGSHQPELDHWDRCLCAVVVLIDVGRDQDEALIVELNIAQDLLERVGKALLRGARALAQIFGWDLAHWDAVHLTLDSDRLDHLNVRRIMVGREGVAQDGAPAGIVVHSRGAKVQHLRRRDVDGSQLERQRALPHARDRAVLVSQEPVNRPLGTRRELADPIAAIVKLRIARWVVGLSARSRLIDHLEDRETEREERQHFGKEIVNSAFHVVKALFNEQLRFLRLWAGVDRVDAELCRAQQHLECHQDRADCRVVVLHLAECPRRVQTAQLRQELIRAQLIIAPIIARCA